MLLVSGIKPYQKGYVAQNSQQKSLNGINLQSKPDSVHFTSVTSEAIKVAEEADAQVEKMTQDIFEKYADVFGENFKTKFLEPVNNFLAERGVKIRYIDMNELLIRTHTIKSKSGLVKDASRGNLIDTDRNFPIHPSTDGFFGKGTTVFAVSKNGVAARIFDKLIEGKMKIYPEYKKFFDGVKFPEELVETSKRVNGALDELSWKWVYSRHDNDDLKAMRLQKAFKTLMPED